MRRLVIKLLLFFAVTEGLAHINLMVLLSAVGVGIALVICTDLLLASASPR
jgi:hypothetical protein